MHSRMIAFCIGVVLAGWIPVVPHPLLLCTLSLPLLLLRYWPWLKMSTAYCLGLAWGLGFVWLSVEHMLPQPLERADIWVWGEMVTLPQEQEHARRFNFKVESMCPLSLLAACGTDKHRWSRTIVLSDYNFLDMVPGEKWRLKVRLKRPHGFANPGSFDYEAWLLHQGISATGYIREDEGNRSLTPGKPVWRIVYWRFQLSNALSHQFTQASGLAHAGLIRALTIGDRYGISQDQWAVFRNTGTIHLVVISGLHIGMIAMLGFMLARYLTSRCSRLCRYLPAPTVAALAAIVTAFGYSALAGFSLPTQRACLMVTVMMWGRVTGRETRVVDSLTLALGAILLLSPLAPLGNGFWLSFVAVAILVSVGGQTHGDVSGWKYQLLALFNTQWRLFIGLAPLLLILFQQLSLLAPVVNGIAIPLVSLLVVPLCLLALILLPLLPPVSLLLFRVTDRVLGYFLDALAALLHIFPQSVLQLPALGFWSTVLVCTGAVLLLLVPHWPWKITGVFCLLPLVIARPTVLQPGSFNVHILDVGQGLAVVVRTSGHTLVFDSGPAYSERFNAGEGIVLPFLAASNIKQVDRIMISHGDGDHAGGLMPISRQFPDAYYLGSDIDQLPDHVSRASCRKGMGWVWDDVSFKVLHPDSRRAGRNNNSCVLHISNGQHAVLIPGDIERSIENLLARDQTKALAAEILVAPHHGSNTSSTLPFIQAVNPVHVVFANGYLNSFGHPHPAVLSRYRRINTHIWSTADSGALGFHLPARGILPEPLVWRWQHPRFWYQQ